VRSVWGGGGRAYRRYGRRDRYGVAWGDVSPRVETAYAEAAKSVAAAKNLALVDLHAGSIAAINDMTNEQVRGLRPTPPGEPRADGTHLPAKGGAVMAALVADELRKAEPAFAPLLAVPQAGGKASP
jgi:hypothetical protein